MDTIRLSETVSKQSGEGRAAPNARLQRWFGPSGCTIGLRMPNALFRPPRRRTRNVRAAAKRK